MNYQIQIPEDRGVKYQMFRYPAGELQVRLDPEELKKIQKSSSVEVTARLHDGEIMELALLTDAIQSVPYGFYMRKMNLILPYLPYGRADRRFVKGDCFGLKVWGRQLEALGYNSVSTYDVHSTVAKSCIYHLRDLDPLPFIRLAIKDIGKKSLMLLFPDEGAINRYDLSKLKIPMSAGGKIRHPATGELSGFFAPSNVMNYEKILIIDDICDGGGTFIGLAQEIKKLNPKAKLYLYVTHGIFSQGTDKLYDIFTEIYSTNSWNVKAVKVILK